MVDQLLEDIDAAVRARLYSVALVGLLTLPDICGAIEYGEDVPPGERYVNWLEEYGKLMWNDWPEAQREVFGPSDIYELRCQVFHLGKVARKDPHRRRIEISVPVNGIHVPWPTLTGEVDAGSYWLPLPGFKVMMLKTVRHWQERRAVRLADE